MWHGGIKVDRTAVGIGGHGLSDLFTALVGVFIARCRQFVRGDEPGHFYLAALAVGEGGHRHLREDYVLGWWHRNRHVFQSRNVHGITAVAVAVDVPRELQVLAQQVVGHAPHGIDVEGLTVRVTIDQTLDVAVGLGQREVVGGVALCHVDAAAYVGSEMYPDVLVVVVGVAVSPPVEAGRGVGPAVVGPRHLQVAVVHPAVGTVHVIDGGGDADGVRPVEHHLILPGVVNMCGRRRLWQQPCEDCHQQHPMPRRSSFLHNVLFTHILYIIIILSLLSFIINKMP